MDVGTVVQEELKFRGVEFAIKVELQDRLLTVEISDIMTADQWRGEFDPACKCAHFFNLNLILCCAKTFPDLHVVLFQTLKISLAKLATLNSSPYSVACSNLQSIR